MDITTLTTFGALKAAGYQSKSIKTELRANLIAALKSGKETFPGMHGYEQTVIPQLERAILSKHNINLLGLRGQGKTRFARAEIAGWARDLDAIYKLNALFDFAKWVWNLLDGLL